jgi:hypothetical protein
LMYGDGIDPTGKSGERVVLVVEAEPGVRDPSRWLRVSGWMRGWMPAASGKARRVDDDVETETETDVGSETETDLETEPDTETEWDEEQDERDALLVGGELGKGYGSVK